MNMNVRFGRKLVLLALVSAAAPTTAIAADSSGPAFGTPRITSAALRPTRPPKRSDWPARPLRWPSAPPSSPPKAKPPRVQPSSIKRRPGQRDAAEVMISDADPQPLPPRRVGRRPAKRFPAPCRASVGEAIARRPPASSASRIRRCPPASTLPMAASQPPAVAAPAQPTVVASAESFELKLAEAALASQSNTDRKARS